MTGKAQRLPLLIKGIKQWLPLLTKGGEQRLPLLTKGSCPSAHTGAEGIRITTL